MRNYILVAHRDKSNPCAVESKLEFVSKNGVKYEVVYVNVPHTSFIAPALTQIMSSIKTGKAKTSQEGKDLVAKLAALTKKELLRVDEEIVRYISHHLGENLCKKCIMVSES